MDSGGLATVLGATNRDEFRGALVRATRGLGFNTFSAMTVLDRGPGRSDFILVDNTPADYSEPYADPLAFRRDPVMQHCKRETMPIVWDRHTYQRSGAMDLWEQQAAHGYCTGIAMAFHQPGGRHFLLGVDRDQSLPQDEREVERLLAHLQLLAVYANEVAQRIFLNDGRAIDRPALTPRELETLHWTMEGKTAWEVGAILGISERTAVMHLTNAMRKLGCASKHQAVLKALRLGLIH
ncbi:MAG: LuxR family transcriptional regulator [Rubrivivax sp.]|jgi:DNA-binding CsgD family transcriptional regulator